MSIAFRSRIIVFVLSFLVWLALTTVRDIQEVVTGVIIAFLVSAIAGHFLITTDKQRHLAVRIMYAIAYLLKFLWEMIKANVHVAYLVVHPMVPVKPGIVKIRTNLTKDTAMTVLANSITLTPGTLTVDVNAEKQELYIHWITVRTDDIEENTREVGGRFEGLLREVFE